MKTVYPEISSPANGRESVRILPRQVSLWDAVSRHRLFLALCLMASLGVGVLVYSLLPTVYQSTAQVLVWQKRPDAMLSVDSRNAAIEDSLGTQQELLKSSVILDRAIREHDLASLSSLQAEKDATTERIRRNLTVSRSKSSGGGNNNVLQVSYRGKVADECAEVLAAVLNSYKKFLDEKYHVYAGGTLELVLRERADLAKELSAKEASYRAFLETSPLLLKKPDGADLSRDRLASIQTRRSSLLLRREELQSQIDRIESALRQDSGRETILALIADFAQRTEQTEGGRTLTAPTTDHLTLLLLEEQKLLERFGADHPEVRSVRKRIAIARDILVAPATAWESGIERAGDQAGDPVQRHLQILRQKLQYATETEERLRQLFEDERIAGRKLARYEIEDESFRTGIALTRQSYDALNKRLQDAHLMRDAGGFDVEIVSPPSEGRKIAPSMTLLLPAAALLGLLASLGLVYLHETRGRKLRGPEDIRQQLGLPILGCIPVLTGALPRNSSPVDPLLCTHHQPRSAGAEAYRRLRNALLFQTGEPSRTVLQITSPGSGDGKSILAANLAVSLAQGGKKVILVEADLHRPRLPELFRLTPSRGLVQVLAGACDLNEAIEDSGLAGLSVLLAGPPPRDAIDLLASLRFQNMLDDLRKAYDFVLVDTPPLLSATEAAAVAARVDGVLLAVRLTRCSRLALERSVEMLATVGANVLGVVVNG